MMCQPVKNDVSALFVSPLQTYVNNRPVRGGSARVNHNDAIRFGYGKPILKQAAAWNALASSCVAMASEYEERVFM